MAYYIEEVFMNEFISLFRKVNGKLILREYFNAHVLGFALAQTVFVGLSKKSLEIVRLSASNRIVNKLEKKYRTFIKEYKKNAPRDLPRVRSDKVWILWLQGMENAPSLIQRCYQSLKEKLKDKEIILLSENNYRDYVKFPKYIQEKIDSGLISKTHMSNLVRLELLIHYGGTWIDSTVFCSGTNIPRYILDSDLFVYQCLKPGLDGHRVCISSWLMTACTNHPILLLTRALLYRYWKEYDRLLEYHLFHDMFQLAIEAYPEEWKKVIPFSNASPHILLLRLFEPFDQEIWNAVTAQTAFHKLSYKFEDQKIAGTYYERLIKRQEIRHELY